MSGIISQTLLAEQRDASPSSKKDNLSIFVRPAQVISKSCATNANPNPTKGKALVMRFTNLSVGTDGIIKIKRNIKIHNNFDMAAEVDESPANNLPYRKINGVTNPTPFDIIFGDAANVRDISRIKIVVKKGEGAAFIGTPNSAGGQFEAVMAGPANGEADKFCDLSIIHDNGIRQAVTFSVKSGMTAGFAIGILVPEVDDNGDATGRFLPIYIDPNVKNEG